MLKWIFVALALTCIVTFAWMHLDCPPTECTKWLGWRMHKSGVRRRATRARREWKEVGLATSVQRARLPAGWSGYLREVALATFHASLSWS
jgi:hypothetical protein